MELAQRVGESAARLVSLLAGRADGRGRGETVFELGAVAFDLKEYKKNRISFFFVENGNIT